MTDTVSYHHLNESNADMLLGADVFDNPVDANQLTAFVKDQGHELVFACIDKRIIGMASGNVMLHPDKEPAFFINEVGVNEEMRNQGIGAELTRQLMSIARNKGCQGLWLATEKDNHEARALYKKLKARETMDVVVYDWDGAMDE